MSLRSVIATVVGRSSKWFLQTFLKGGTSLPGKLALKIDPDILSRLAKDYEIIVVTGTNGKTVTTSLITNILREQYGNILTNPSGSNMQQGIVSAFLSAKKNKNSKNFAVLEIDEASLVKVTKYIKPKLFLFTNIFRDQMDRFGEIYNTYRLIVEGAASAPDAPILCNGDAPIFNSIDTANKRIYYGFGQEQDGDLKAHYNTDGVICPKCQQILRYKTITYSNLGKYYCSQCDFKRPELNYTLTRIISQTHVSSVFVVDGEEYALNIGGMYNIYNALSAIAVARYYGVPKDKIKDGLAKSENLFGRQEIVDIDGKKCTLVLVKNPVGLNQVIEMIQLAPRPFSLVCLLNSNYADGLDVSWVWDGNYEKFAKMDIPKVVAGGERHTDIALRLKVAGIDENIMQEVATIPQVIEAIKGLPTDKLYILATYTAVLSLRKELAQRGYMEGGM